MRANGFVRTQIPVTILRNGTELKKLFVNERTGPGKISLGRFQLSKGDAMAVTISNAGTKGHVVADAVQFLESAE